MAEQIEKSRIAVLVDGDNATAALLPHILLEMTKYGRITIKRVYGDWTTPQMRSWKEQLLANAAQPVQQFRYTTGKNATYSAMIIDATDLLNKRLVDVFCIVSSDSDFTRLATRIREDGLVVVGIGARNIAPDAFVKACDVFIYTDALAQEASDSTTSGTVKTVSGETKVKTSSSSGPITQYKPSKEEKAALLQLFKQAFTSVTVAEGGWINLGGLGAALRKIDPAFDVRTYKRHRLSDLVADFPDDLEQHRDNEHFPPIVYARLKNSSP